MSSHSRWILRAIWSAWLLCAGAQGFAQPPRAEVAAPPAAGAAGNSDGTAGQGAAADAPPVVKLPSRGGASPVLVTPTLEQVLHEVRAQREGPAAAPPAYSVTEISLDGEADQDAANLTVSVQVQIDRANQPVLVPLRMAEGILRGFEYAGPGRVTFDDLDAEQGYRWWFRGPADQSLHTLKLKLSVPLRKEAPHRRLQLSLPNTAVSELKLRVPHARITARTDEKSILTVRNRDAVTSEMSVIGIGPRLDLTWQAQPELNSVETVLEARTSLSVSIDGESVLVEANQRILALQGTFAEVDVRLPPGFELLKLEGTAYKEHRSSPDNLNLVTVTLKEPSAGPIDLKWSVRSDLPPNAEKVVIDGFEVERARLQAGNIAVRVVGAYRVAKIDEDSRFVHKITPSDLAKVVPPMPAQGDVVSAFRILRQPFRLTLGLQAVQPFVVVDPYLLLTLSAGQAELLGEFRFQVSKDAVEELTLQWPNWKAEGWTLDPVEPPGKVEQTILDEASGTIRVRLIERTSGRIELRLHARRALTDLSQPVALSFPVAAASNRLSAVLEVALADNVEVDLKPTGATVARPLAAVQTDVPRVPRANRELRSSLLRVDSPTQTFTGLMTVHQRQVSATTEAEVTLEEEQALVSQSIVYDVAYERLSQMLLSVPVSIAARCRYTTVEGTELTPMAHGSVEAGRQEYRLPVEQVRPGRLEIIARYAVESPWPAGADSATLAIPLIQSLDAGFSSARLQIRPHAVSTVAVNAADWQRQPAVAGFQAWTATAPVTEIPLTLSRLGTTTAVRAAVFKVLVWAKFDQQGRAVCRAQYRISDAPALLQLVFPEGSQATVAWWNDKPLSADEFEPNPKEASQYLLIPPADARAGESLLTIDYHFAEAVPFAVFGSQRLSAPRILPDDAAVQTNWDMALPFDQHLLTVPNRCMPLFEWRREGMFWSRANLASPAALRDWIGAVQGPPDSWLAAGDNHYQFSSLGRVPSLNFRTMTLYMIVLIGAGLALAVGFLLMNVRATRHVLTLLLLGFATAVVGVWYPEPVLVLLQPALLGLGLAIMAAGIQGIVQRSRQARILTLSSPSGFMTTPSSVRRELGGAPPLESTALPAGAGHLMQDH